MNLCDDNRIITIEKAKQALIKGTNIEDSPEEMKVLDNILFRCWQMGWLDRYDPPMPSNTSNALEALDSVNATQFNALDSISRQAAINALERTKRIASYELHSGEVLRTFNVVLNSLINIMSLLPPANNSEIPNSSDTISRQAAIEALKNDMASLDHIIKGMSANDVRLDAYVSQRNQVNYDIYTINNLPPAQPEQLSTNLAEVGTDCISRQ